MGEIIFLVEIGRKISSENSEVGDIFNGYFNRMIESLLTFQYGVKFFLFREQIRFYHILFSSQHYNNESQVCLK